LVPGGVVLAFEVRQPPPVPSELEEVWEEAVGIDWGSVGGPSSYRPQDVLPALRALMAVPQTPSRARRWYGTEAARNACVAIEYTVGNGHAGT